MTLASITAHRCIPYNRHNQQPHSPRNHYNPHNPYTSYRFRPYRQYFTTFLSFLPALPAPWVILQSGRERLPPALRSNQPLASMRDRSMSNTRQNIRNALVGLSVAEVESFIEGLTSVVEAQHATDWLAELKEEEHLAAQDKERALASFPVLPVGASKDAEIGHIVAFVASLPASSYLASILVDLSGLCAEEIRNDWAFPAPVVQSWAARSKEERDIKEARARHKEAMETMEAQHAEMTRNLRDLRQSLLRVRDEASDMARTVASVKTTT